RMGSNATIISNATIGNFFKKGPIIEFEISCSPKLPDILSVLAIIFIIITAMIAPVEAIATNPKLSCSDALLSFLSAETPKASARINGTVKAPVVAPDASKDIAKNSGEVNKASTRIIKYKIDNNLYKGKL